MWWLAAALVILSGCSKSKDAGSGSEDAATPVSVTEAKRQPIEQVIRAEAILFPVKQASVVPKISAPVTRFLVERGDHVRQGQLLAVLENRDLAASAKEGKDLYEQAQANYENTRAAVIPEDVTKAATDVQAAKEALDAAKKVYESRVALVREGALAQKLADDAKVTMAQAQSAYETAAEHLKSLQNVGRREQLKSAAEQMAAANAHYEGAAAQAAYAEVRSPLTGVVADRPLNVGEVAGTGSALLSVVDISRVVARANVPVGEAAAIKAGRPATISGAGVELKGKVTVVSPAVDPNTTTVQVWVEAANPKEQLKPGTTVQVSVDAGAVPDAVVVPAAALMASDEGGEKVMVAGADGLAHEHKVEVGVRSGDEVQIVSGVNAGEEVITEGALGLDDKAKIRH